MKRCWNMLLALAVLAVADRALAAADVKVEGWKVTVGAETVTIDPPSVKSGSLDAEMKGGKPSYGGPVLLPGPAWAFAALRRESLVITLVDEAKTKLEEGKDYALDPLWASIASVEGGKAPAGTKIHAEYQYGMSRIDLVERSADGKLAVIKGVEDKGEPLLPAASKGSAPLFSVYMPNGARSLSQDNINMIDPQYDGIPPVTGGETLKGVKAKLAQGKAVTIAFLGDSITEQQMKDFRDKKGSFVVRFASYLQDKYPASGVVMSERGDPSPAPKDKQIIVVKAGKGGDDTPRALQRIDADVLAHKPDVVVVMLGVNDENHSARGNSVPVTDYKANLLGIVEKIRGAGAEPLLMTPSMKNLGWAGTVGNMTDYAKAMREVGAAKKVCVVDCFKAWELLPKRGYNYMVFLGNCINHPVDLGHDLFFRGLKAAFDEGTGK